MTQLVYFQYGETETAYLKAKDKRLGEAIDKIGYINREVNGDLFSSVIHHIVGQQISTAAQKTVWKRVQDMLGDVTAESICGMDPTLLQGCGLSWRKVEYIKDFAHRVKMGQFNVNALKEMPDEQIVKELSALKGIGVWTAEMLMLFCLQRPDVLSFGDLAILRGMRMLYHHKSIDKVRFERYRKRYSPYGSVASLYLWAIAGGAISHMFDYGEKNLKKADDMQPPAKQTF